ncbi:hypothetical protein BDQ17DRAFT_1431920 [Cyathus striatus]|nr:hypothetical protein BDQ17DRAFT_1431920 [Cyathus striatus]
MVNTRKSSSTAAKTDSDQRASRSGSKASANAPAIHDKGGKQTKNKAKKKTSVNRLQDDQNAENPSQFTPVEQVLIEENTSVAPPPHFPSKDSTQVPMGEINDTLNEDESLMPLGSQLETMDLGPMNTADNSDKPQEDSENSVESATDNSDKSLEDSEISMESTSNISDKFQEENIDTEKSEHQYSCDSSKDTESDIENEPMVIDTDITPKKGGSVLKRGRAPSSPTSAHRSISKVSKRSESHNSATSSLSKDDLQGASRITGGFSRGRATGNIFNYGDEEDDSSIMPPDNVKGEIHLFLKPEAQKPAFIITDQEPSFDLQEVLEHVSEVYSPVAKKNSRISLRENGNWNIKGRYMKIMEKEIQSAKWQMDDKNNYFLEILADGADNNETSITKAPSGSSTDDEVVKSLIISHFNIPDIIQASAKADVDKKVLINVFMSPSTYYTYPYKVFPLLKYHPKMLSWMKNEGGIDKKSIWRSQKPGFSSLYDILKGKEAAAEEHKEEQSKGKGKGKEREESDTDNDNEEVKDKYQEDRMSESKGKEKSKKSHRKDKGKSKKL